MRYLLVFVLVVHGLINLLGFVKAFGIAPLEQLTHDISRPAGALWLLAGVLFVLAGALLLAGRDSWWLAALPATLLSQALIFSSWGDAKVGTVANLIVLAALIPSIASAMPGSFASTYKRHAAQALTRTDGSASAPLVTEADLARLPEPVQKYLRFTGSVGKPRVQNFHAVMTGGMAQSPGAKPLPFTAEQYSFYGERARLFFMRSALYGIPFEGLHEYRGADATMKIDVGSVAQVVDARGQKMNQSETVTMFNDMCFLAPATLVDPTIAWEPIDARSAKATFTNGAETISAVLSFDDAGRMVDFYSDDRFMSADGKTYENYRWSTPISDYREFDGRTIASRGRAIWHMPQGDYSYITFDIKDIAYNVAAR
jgi:uncharacterized membrane protein YphA (DoxX/SURF4 family)